MRPISCMALLIFTGLLTSCAHGPNAPPPAMANKDANFVLDISNQSCDVRRVRIQVTIDRELLVDDRFHIGCGLQSQHKWTEFCLKLDEGSHTLEARVYKSEEVLAQLTETFSVRSNKRWGSLSFYKKRGEKGDLRLKVYEHQPGRL